MTVGVAASYRLGVLGYGVGMALSVTGDVGIGLALLTTTSIAAIVLFISEHGFR